jgi:hypothetical protein
MVVALLSGMVKEPSKAGGDESMPPSTGFVFPSNLP